METFNAEDMYHMFDARTINNDIAYVKNTISYPDFLLKFINFLQKYQEEELLIHIRTKQLLINLILSGKHITSIISIKLM